MKRHLLFAMLCIVGALNVSAQEDVTDTYLTNANLSSLTGWTQSGYTDWKTDGAVPVIEFWNWSTQFNFSQTVTLPAGNYRIAVNSFYRNSWNGDGTNNDMAWIYAGSQTKNVVALNSMNDLSGYAGSNDLYRAATAFSQGKFSNEFDFDLTEESTIELGFRGTCPNGGWCILGPVKLYKYSLEDYLVDYRAKVAEAQALNEADMFPTAWENLQAAIVDESTFALVSEVTAAINTLSAAISAAKTSISIKSSAGDKLAKMKEVTEATNFYTDEAYETYYGQWKAKYDAGTLTEEEASALQNPYTTTNSHANITVDDLLLSSWDVEPNFAGDYYINSWSTEDNNNGFGTPFFEYWVGSGSLAEKTMTATIVGLEANQLYSVEILARIQVSGTKADNSIRMQVGEGTAVDLTTGEFLAGTRYMGKFTAIGTTDASGNLIVTITVDANSGISWLSWKNAKYQKLDDERIPYAEQLAQLVAQAQSLSTTLIVPDGVKNALNNTANTYDGYTYESLPTVAAFQETIATVQNAIKDAQDAEATYAKYNELKGYATNLLAVDYTDLVESAHSTYAAAVTEPTLNTKADIDAAYEALHTATMTYVANADPTEGNQFDLTFLLTNPDVTSFWDSTWGIRPEGWYTDQLDDAGNVIGNFQVMANEEMGPGGQVFMEYWDRTAKTSGFVLYQKVTLPEGTYKMSGRVGLNQIGDGAPGTTANMTFSANDTDGSQITVGPLSDQEVEFINTANQEVKIGIKAQAGNCYRWIGINKIKLYKTPTANTEYNIVTNADNATVAVTVNDVEANVAKKLDAVKLTITPNEEYSVESVTITYVDDEDATQTISPTLLSENVYTFQMPAYDVNITVKTVNPALEAVMEYYLELKDYADALVAAPTDNETAQTTLANAISTAETDIAAAATSTQAEAVNAALKAAMITYAGEATPTDETQPFNLTFMVQNPDVTDLWVLSDESDPYSGKWLVTPEGWGTEQELGNFQVMRNANVDAADGVHNVFTEYYYLDDNHLTWGNNKFNVYTSVEGMPAGTYNMSCYAFAREQNYSSENPNPQVYFFANDTQGSLVNSNTMTEQSIEFVNNASQDVRIGLKPLDGNTYNWMGIGYVELYKVPAKNIVIDQDDDEYDYTQEVAGDVILRRPIKEGYNTVVLPFSMTQQEVEDVFGQGSTISVLASYNAETQHLRFTKQDGIQPNKPCLLNATQPVEEGADIQIPGRTLVPARSLYPEFSVEGATMIGTYEDQTNVPVNSWFVKSGQLVYAATEGSCWVNMTRAYITLEGWTPDAAGVKGLTISFEDGDATGIINIENGEMNILTGKIFDLSGREVKNPTRGIYIVNGKKVMIK